MEVKKELYVVGCKESFEGKVKEIIKIKIRLEERQTDCVSLLLYFVE